MTTKSDLLTCGCWMCLAEYDKQHPPINDPFMGQCARFIVCKICGNKRCPHATDHRLACTNSNEPGQKGSNYE